MGNMFQSNTISKYEFSIEEQNYFQALFNSLEPNNNVIQATHLKEQYKNYYDLEWLNKLIGNKDTFTFEQFIELIISIKEKNLNHFNQTLKGNNDETQKINTQKQKGWGKLISINHVTSQDYELIENEITIGRGFMNSLWIKDNRLSQQHCKLVFNGNSQTARLTDLSLNGTYLEEHKIGVGNDIIVKNGDKIYLFNKSGIQNKSQTQSEIIGFIIIIYQTNGRIILKEIQEPQKRDELSNLLFEILKCYICKWIVYQAVTLLPCQHVFCSSCFSHYYQQQFKICPKCGVNIEFFFLNKNTDLIAYQLLEQHQDLKRPKEDYLEMDTINKNSKLNFKESQKKSVKILQMIQTDKIEQISKVNQNEQQIEQSNYCSICEQYKYTKQFKDGDIPNSIEINCFRQNQFEMEIFVNYIKDKGITCQGIFKQMCDNYISIRMFRYVICKRTHINLKKQKDIVIKMESQICLDCFKLVWEQLVFRYRISIKNELPDEVKCRKECKYGINCQKMINNNKHAQSYDHMCEQQQNYQNN